MSRRSVLITAAVIAVVGAAACSSDGQNSAPTSSPGGSTSAPPSTQSSSSAAPTGLRASLLQQSDLPSGWTAKQHDASNDDPATDQQINAALARCTGTTAPPTENDAGELHADFMSGTSLIESSAKPARNVEARQTFLRQIVASPKANQCTASVLRSFFIKLAPPGATFDNPTATVSGRVTNGSKVLMASFRIRGKLAVQGQQQTIDSTTVNIVGDKAEAELDFTFYGSSPSAGLVDDAAAAVAARVAKA